MCREALVTRIIGCNQLVQFDSVWSNPVFKNFICNFNLIRLGSLRVNLFTILWTLWSRTLLIHFRRRRRIIGPHSWRIRRSSKNLIEQLHHRSWKFLMLSERLSSLKTQDQRDKLASLEQQAKKTISKLFLQSVVTIIFPIAELIWVPTQVGTGVNSALWQIHKCLYYFYEMTKAFKYTGA